MHIRTVRLHEITVDPEIQARAGLDQAAVEEYAELMRQRVKFPPLVAFDDCHQVWLAGGFHRYAAAQLAGLTEIEVELDEGTRDAAILFACGDNAKHGVRRTTADKWRAVTMLLARPEWAKWSDREIAERCNVTHPFVAKVRRSLTGNVSSEETRATTAERTYTTRHGTTATMHTANIGRGRANDDRPAGFRKASRPFPSQRLPVSAFPAERVVNLRVESPTADAKLYATHMRYGVLFPPVVAFHDGAGYWLADGKIRLEAAKLAGLDAVEAHVLKGGKRDASLYAAGANATSGMNSTIKGLLAFVGEKIAERPDLFDADDEAVIVGCNLVAACHAADEGVMGEDWWREWIAKWIGEARVVAEGNMDLDFDPLRSWLKRGGRRCGDDAPTAA